jgi:hypothetical protein
VPGQTSGQVLARFQTDVIDLHPAIVNIITGTYDVSTLPWPIECGPATGPTATCNNLASMTHMASAAGIKVIVGTIPTYGSDDTTAAFGNAQFLNRGLIQ